MSEPGTGYIIGTEIESSKGTLMRDLDFSLEFYVHENRRLRFAKKDLVHIAMTDGDQYYALVDSSRLGEGVLQCRVTILDNEPKWTGGKRPIILKRSTGKVIGGCGLKTSPMRCQWEEGFRISFNFVDGLPKPEVGYIFYGHLVNQLTLYADITADMLVSPENHIISVNAGAMGKTSCGIMNEGDKVVVLIPVDTAYTATKDNGFGGQMPFNTSLLGANGEPIVEIDGVHYRAYGEMMTTEGEMFVYVN